MPEFSDEQADAFVDSLVHLADGPRVRVLRSSCQRCGAEEWPYGPGEAWTVAAPILRAIASQWHNDGCPGPIQFETEPAAGEAGGEG